MKLPGRFRLGWGLAASFVAGLLQAASIAWPVSGQALGSLQITSLTLLCLCCAQGVLSPMAWKTPVASAALQAGVFATAWLAGSFWWLYVSMHDVGGLSAPLAVLAVLALAGALALYYAGAVAVWAALVLRKRWQNQPVRAGVLFAALWTLAELMRGRWFTGFPWGAGGYAHVDSPLAVFAPWVGVYGVGAIAAGLAMVLAMTLNSTANAVKSMSTDAPKKHLHPTLSLVPPRSVLATAAAVFAVCMGLQVWPPVFTASAGTGQVELLQANIAQTDKFDSARGIRDALDWYAKRLVQSQQPLVVAPETAIPLLPQFLPEGYWAGLHAALADKHTQLALVGVPMGDAVRGYTNAVVGMGPVSLSEYRYDKFHLVPFGEFIPTGFRWFVQSMQIPMGDFSRGALNPPSIDWQGQRLAVNICYEDLFGEELAARFGDADQAPTALVNVSNIGWFGNTLAVDQHLSISRMRALELQRPMLRATNTGATALIDHTGRVTGELPRFTRGSLVGSYEGRTGLTPFARWASAWGLWPVWGLALLVVALALLLGRRR